MRFALLLAFVLVAASAASVDEEDWEFYKQKFNKKYSSGREHHYRKGVFLKNRDEILNHNARFEAGLATHQTGVNQFSDMGKEEFNSYASCLKVPANFGSDDKKNSVYRKKLSATKLPEQVDWREKGAVTEVKDQGDCGSCWAFSTTGSVEGRHFMESGKLVSLSEQNLLDCDRTYSTDGCNGGWPPSAFNFIIEEGGIDTEESYPYLEGSPDQHPTRECHFNASTVGAEIKSYTSVPETTEDLMAAVAHKGPISVAVFAGSSFQHYMGGILSTEECKESKKINHGVLLVGYGTSTQGIDYWIIKNSWGPSWGEGGFIRVRRGYGNDCMILTAATYAD